ncbi:hypothetical protein [Metaplanococcus flavidus]|uniref:Uncharacterized protein n=1 Tax=Metaplanococcus flavidus TaxID=569883 RepID=A0ABW3LAV9_9BACL
MWKLPLKIQQELEKNPQLQWIEEQDRVYEETDLTDKLKMENQYLFWKKNCDIRMALIEIEKVIKATPNPSVRLAGWSELARTANCDRNTLRQPQRFLWVNEARERLILLIQKEKSVPVELTAVITEEESIKKLEREIVLSKKESAKWFLKFEEVDRENKLLRKAMERQTTMNTALQEELKNLRDKIKKLT